MYDYYRGPCIVFLNKELAGLASYTNLRDALAACWNAYNNKGTPLETFRAAF